MGQHEMTPWPCSMKRMRRAAASARAGEYTNTGWTGGTRAWGLSERNLRKERAPLGGTSHRGAQAGTNENVGQMCAPSEGSA